MKIVHVSLQGCTHMRTGSKGFFHMFPICYRFHYIGRWGLQAVLFNWGVHRLHRYRALNPMYDPIFSASPCRDFASLSHCAGTLCRTFFVYLFHFVFAVQRSSPSGLLEMEGSRKFLTVNFQTCTVSFQNFTLILQKFQFLQYNLRKPKKIDSKFQKFQEPISSISEIVIYKKMFKRRAESAIAICISLDKITHFECSFHNYRTAVETMRIFVELMQSKIPLRPDGQSGTR